MVCVAPSEKPMSRRPSVVKVDRELQLLNIFFAKTKTTDRGTPWPEVSLFNDIKLTGNN